MIDTMILFIILGVFILIAYTLGLRNGQKLSNKEEVKSPIINPIDIVSKEVKKQEENKKKEKLDIIMANIDSYDGSGIGQKDIPKDFLD